MVADFLRNWIVDSDPALRWQVERDLLDEPSEVRKATRARVAIEGFGARILALQDPDGTGPAAHFSPRTSMVPKLLGNPALPPLGL